MEIYYDVGDNTCFSSFLPLAFPLYAQYAVLPICTLFKPREFKGMANLCNIEQKFSLQNKTYAVRKKFIVSSVQICIPRPCKLKQNVTDSNILH